MANPVNWFEIPTRDLERAKRFYESVLACELSLQEMGPLKMAWFPMVENAPYATGTLIYHETTTPALDGTVVYFHVDDVDAALARVTSAGGKVLTPKTPIGEHGFTAHFEDSEGNRVALHSTK